MSDRSKSKNQNSNVSGFFSKIKNRFFSVFRVKSSQRDSKSRNDVDPSPATVSKQIERHKSAKCSLESSSRPPKPQNQNEGEEKIVVNDLFINGDDSNLIIGGGRLAFVFIILLCLEKGLQSNLMPIY